MPLLLGAIAASDNLVAVDPFNAHDPDYGEQRLPSLQAHLAAIFGTAEPDHLVLLQQRSQDLAANELRKSGSTGGHRRPFRLAHIDGSHELNDVAADVRLVDELLHKQAGLVIVDDVYNARWPAVGAAWWQTRPDHLQPFAILGQRLLAARSLAWCDRYLAALVRSLGKPARMIDWTHQPLAVFE